MYQAIFFF